MGIINDNFILKSKTAKKLYKEFTKDLPIIDYHCHLSPQMIAEDYKFKSAYDLFWAETITNGDRCAQTALTRI